MLLLGLLLVGATAAFTGLVIADNTSGGPDYAVTVIGQHIATMNTLEVFLAGVALSLLFCLGVAMMSGGGRRVRRHRSDLKSARREARDATAERDLIAARTADRTDDPGTAGKTTDPAAEERRTPPRHRHGRHLFGH